MPSCRTLSLFSAKGHAMGSRCYAEPINEAPGGPAPAVSLTAGRVTEHLLAGQSWPPYSPHPLLLETTPGAAGTMTDAGRILTLGPWLEESPS